MAGIKTTGWKLGKAFIAGTVASFAMKRVTSFLESRQRAPVRVSDAFSDRKSAERALVDRMNKRLNLRMRRKKRKKVARRVKMGLGAGIPLVTIFLRKRLDATENPARAAALDAATFVFANEVLKPAMAGRSIPRKLPWQTHATAVTGHAAYGLVNAGVRRVLP